MPDETSELDKQGPQAKGSPAAANSEGAAQAVNASPPPPTSPANSTKEANAAPGAAAPKPATAAKPVPPAAAKPTPLPWDGELVQKLKREYGSGIREAATYLKDKYLVVDKSIVFDVLRRLRDDEQFEYCVDITAVHWPKREEPFDVVYILYSFAANERVRVETTIKECDKLRSVYSIWPTADWLEREVFDMFGIEFSEHPGLKRILLPDAWTGYPLRKDYGLRQQDQKWVNEFIGIESGQ